MHVVAGVLEKDSQLRGAVNSEAGVNSEDTVTSEDAVTYEEEGTHEESFTCEKQLPVKKRGDLFAERGHLLTQFTNRTTRKSELQM